ncbi:MAG: hypothetical protein JSV56_08975 [Methanomassiliicoccales archaeon]|nr:MAG: hypothetical protein JSV56_08975 [Methanomassiliicoccales archaeon]
MGKGRIEDKELLSKKSKDELIEHFFLQMRNLWTVDGLYFLGIEEKYGTEGATEIDKNVWEVMGKIEARRLKDTLGITGDDIPTLMDMLRLTSWSLDLEEKEIIVEKKRGLFRNPNCRVQKTRLKKGLKEFPCKEVRWGYLKNFTKEFSENIVVECNVCPPDEHEENLWCEWEFKLKR